jgi:hypothetical protein
MVTVKKPEAPTSALSNAGPEELMEGKLESNDSSRTRPPLQNCGTYGDTVYPGCHHTSDPAAPKVNKVL